MSLRIAIYARESVDDTKRAPPIENQIELARSENNNNPELKGEIVKIYSDDGWSGGAWNRPAWNEMLKAAVSKPKLFDVILVWSDDRLARDTEQFLQLMRIMSKENIQIFDVTKKGFMDMDTASGRFSNTVFAAASEYQRLHTSDKVKRLYAIRKKQAEKNNERVKWGRQPIPEEIALKAEQLFKEGFSVGMIAKQLPRYEIKRKGEDGRAITRQPSRAWVWLLLKNRGYALSSLKPTKMSSNHQLVSNKTIVEQEKEVE